MLETQKVDCVIQIKKMKNINKHIAVQEKSSFMQQVEKLLKEAETYYLAIVEGNQTRGYPFGTVHIFEGKLYIQTGKKYV